MGPATVGRDLSYLNNQAREKPKVLCPRKITGTISNMYEWTKPSTKDEVEHRYTGLC